jgi:pimeloyl-ACP methyl ester carboxylesterase
MKPDQAIRLEQGMIRYRDIGSGPAIVFVHGLLVNGDLWRGLVPILSRTHRCLIPDWPLGSHSEAMNASTDLSPPGMARMIADFITALKLKDVTLVGNDSGGALCQLVVTMHPDCVGRLVLTNCDAFENFLPPLFRYLQYGAHLPGFLEVMARVIQLRALHRLPFTFGWLSKRPIDSQVIAGYLRPALENPLVRRDLRNFLKGISNRYTLEAAQRFASFRKPVLVVWASEDRLFPLEHGRRLSKLFPDARLEQIENALTFVPEDQPALLAISIATFTQEAALV